MKRIALKRYGLDINIESFPNRSEGMHFKSIAGGIEAY